MKHFTIGILAHVDAGKTTLIEQLLVAAGQRKEAGRVDHGTAFLDTEEQERARGITISSKMCRLSAGGLDLTLMDTPGHVDFTAETERVLPVLDAAVLLIGAGERIPAHAGYLFRLLRERGIPTVVFFNKMDLPVPGKDALIRMLRDALGEGFADWYGDRDAVDEAAAELEEELLERYLAEGTVEEKEYLHLFRKGRFYPCCFGSALRGEGIRELLECLTRFLGGDRQSEEEKEEQEAPFGAYCYKILHDGAGQKWSFLKILSGKIAVRDQVEYGSYAPEEPEESRLLREKVTQLRQYNGADFEAIPSAEKGELVAVAGLTATRPGCGIGIAPSGKPEVSRPMLRYRLVLPAEVEPRQFLPKLRLLEEEETTLSVEWREDREEIEVELYGEVQLEILTERIKERYGITVSFDEGNVVYRETLAEPSYGVGHFEPLRHYAEVHFLLEPLPRGMGILLESRLSTDELDRSWQQTILTAVEKESLTGVLVNAKLTDLRITLTAGRAHKKHTEGGDFREAALRAVRQGLMAGKPELLEPYVRFSLTVPQAAAGRALYDMDQLAEESRITEQTEGCTTIEGRGPVSGLRNYMAEVRSYTHGEGVFRMLYDGYDRCRNTEEVRAAIGYEPEKDLARPAGSVLVDHGTAEQVSWQDAPKWMHIAPRFTDFYPEEDPEDPEDPEEKTSGKGSRGKSLEERLQAIGTEEIDTILQRAGGANQSAEGAKERKNRWAAANRRSEAASGSGRNAKAGSPSDTAGAEGRNRRMPGKTQERTPYLLVDGYNIIHAWEETRELVKLDLNTARGVLLDMLTEYRALTTREIIVVFDAYRVSGHRTEVMDYQNLHVVFTREAETADQYIARFTTEHEKKYAITVATSDGMIQLIIRGADAGLMSARELREEVLSKKAALRDEFRL